MGCTNLKRKRRRGKFRYRANLRKKSFKQNNRLAPPVNRIEIQREWNKQKSASKNFKDLGLVYNLNKAMKPQDLNCPKPIEEMAVDPPENSKPLYVSTLKPKRRKTEHSSRISPIAEEYITYLLNKYGEDYKAMTRDGRNCDQESWKQLRKKVQIFKNCHDQYAQYLKKRNLFDSQEFYKSKSNVYESDGELN